MALLAYQSPLSILGLKYSVIPKNDILKAIRLAKLHCHPDKPQNPAIPHGYYALVDAAGQYLLGGGSIEKFKGYPVLFFPQRDNIGNGGLSINHSSISSRFSVCSCGEVNTEKVESIHTSGCDNSIHELFTICYACKTAIPDANYRDHISDHTDLCELCNEVLDEEHYSKRHPDTMCPWCDVGGIRDMHSHVKTHAIENCDACQTKDIAELLGHVVTDHFICPLCQQECGDDFESHLNSIHYFQVNKDCIYCADDDNYSLDDILLHFLRNHQWTVCPRCQLHVAQGQLWVHLARTHPTFQRCTSCPRTEEAFAADITHVTEHIQEYCMVCEKRFSNRELPLHQLISHNWLLCEYCNRVEETKELLIEHQNEDHRFFECPDCSGRVLEEQRNVHLNGVHGWRLCPWCKTSFSEDTIRTHMEVSHPPTTKCSICTYTGTVGGLKQHMKESHGWKLCPSCDRALPADKFIEELQCNTCIDKNPKATDTSSPTENIQEFSAKDLPDEAKQEFYKQTISHPAPESRQQSLPQAKRKRYKGKQNNRKKKCPRCRQDKQSCERPHERHPCERCKHYNYSCGMST
ncbi:hypothetical protein V8C42DRAFT_336688 [Trichoderma barbatum]